MGSRFGSGCLELAGHHSRKSSFSPQRVLKHLLLLVHPWGHGISELFPLQKPYLLLHFSALCSQAWCHPGVPQGTTHHGLNLEEESAKLLQDEAWRTLGLPLSPFCLILHNWGGHGCDSDKTCPCGGECVTAHWQAESSWAPSASWGFY